MTTSIPEPGQPLVSVVLVNYKGASDTITAIEGLRTVAWPPDRLEVIVVDNDSQDGSEEAIRVAAPEVSVVAAGRNLGFSGGCNLGAARARGEIVAFLNTDARPHPQWVQAAVAVLEQEPSVAAVASKVLSWDGELIDYAGASVTWYGMGYKPNSQVADSDNFNEAADVLFASGAAMFVRADLFRQVGGFDERFFMFFEDVDLGWRLNLLGHRVRYVPQSVAFHRHHGAMRLFGSHREMFFLERNSLICLYKNLSDDVLPVVFGPALALSVRRAKARADEEERVEASIRGGKRAIGALAGPARRAAQRGEGVRKTALTSPYAIDDFLRLLPDLSESRRQLQARRERSDAELMSLFGDLWEPLGRVPGNMAANDALMEVCGITESINGAPRVIVVTGDVITEKMAGPAIRAWEMATALARVCSVRLITTTRTTVKQGPGFSVYQARKFGLRPHIDWSTVIVFQGFLLAENPWIAHTDRVIVADIYDPFHLEQLEQAKDLGEARCAELVGATTAALNQQIERADLLLCASPKQRDFWLGQAAVVGRCNRLVSRQYGDISGLIKIVPFGVSDEPPKQRRHGLRGTVPGIGPDDKIILWGGGVYNWFDPLTLVRAVAALAERHANVRLYFMGLKHPNPDVPQMKVAWQLRQLSDELGLTGRHVFFNENWVPYHERADVLLDADVGVSTHFEHVETAYSFRTRILDYLWAGLPIVATVGDSFGNMLDDEGIGIGVPPEDVEALTVALEKLLYDDEATRVAKVQVARVAEAYRWSTVLSPLVEFCRCPVRAEDLRYRPPTGDAGLPAEGWRGDLTLAWDYLRTGGPKLVVERVSGRLRRRGEDR